MTYKQQVAARLDEVTQPKGSTFFIGNDGIYANDGAVFRRISRHYRYAHLPMFAVTSLMIAGALGLGFALGVIWSNL